MGGTRYSYILHLLYAADNFFLLIILMRSKLRLTQSHSVVSSTARIQCS
jgi:hypothetical protein